MTTTQEADRLAEECKRLAVDVRFAITQQCLDPSAKNVHRCDTLDRELARAIDRLRDLSRNPSEPFCWLRLDPFGNPHPAGDGQEGAFPVYRGNPSVEGEESEFVVQLTTAGTDDEVCAASTFGPRETALAEALNYARQYEEEGVVQVYEITRTPIGGAAMAATPKEPR